MSHSRMFTCLMIAALACSARSTFADKGPKYVVGVGPPAHVTAGLNLSMDTVSRGAPLPMNMGSISTLAPTHGGINGEAVVSGAKGARTAVGGVGTGPAKPGGKNGPSKLGEIGPTSAEVAGIGY